MNCCTGSKIPEIYFTYCRDAFNNSIRPVRSDRTLNKHDHDTYWYIGNGIPCTVPFVDCWSCLYRALKYCRRDLMPMIALFRARLILALMVVEFIANQFCVTHVDCSKCSYRVSTRSSWTLGSIWLRWSYKSRRLRCTFVAIALDLSVSVAPCKSPFRNRHTRYHCSQIAPMRTVCHSCPVRRFIFPASRRTA